MTQSRRRRKGGCPICGAPVVPEHRPFCSSRCADADLARWLDERYRVPAVEPDEAVHEAAGEDEEEGR